MKICPNCNKEFEDGKFCNECGTKLVEKVDEKFCPNCGVKVESGAKFCGECGAKLMVEDYLQTQKNVEIIYDLKYDDKNFNVDECKKSADSGYAPALFQLGEFYFSVDDTNEVALEYYKKSADLEYVKAQEILGLLYGVGINGAEENLTLAIEWYEKAIKNGSIGAKTSLAEIYLEEEHLGKTKEAIQMLIESAENGDSTASMHLGRYYEDGKGGAQDFNLSFNYYNKASKDNLFARFKTGQFYFYGIAVEEDEDKAYSLFESVYKESSEDERFYGDLCYFLGYCYFYGVGTSENKGKAEQLLLVSAKSGDAEAMEAMGILGDLYRERESYKAAEKWYKKAIENGNFESYNGLGFLYMIDGDKYNAYLQFKEAATNDSVMGMVNLSYCYRNGYGVSKDKNQADRWMNKAADNGYEPTKEDYKEDISFARAFLAGATFGASELIKKGLDFLK